MAAPVKPTEVKRLAINQITEASGYKNRLDIPQHVVDNGFQEGEIPRQWVNDILYNHGENLTYCMYYNNRPLSIASKNALPSAADNDGVIYYVSDQKKLVMSAGSKWLVMATLGGEI